MMTVKELIEALEKCPQDEIVSVVVDGFETNIDFIKIDNEFNTVEIHGQ